MIQHKKRICNELLSFYSDFGLSRRIDADVYMQKSDSKIPVKWYDLLFRYISYEVFWLIGMHQKQLVSVNLPQNLMFGLLVLLYGKCFLMQQHLMVRFTHV